MVGDNSNGQLGLGDYDPREEFTLNVECHVDEHYHLAQPFLQL